MKIAVMAIALVMTGLVFAQEGNKQRPTPEERAYRLTTKMIKHLTLDGEQASKVAEINLGIAQKNEGVRTNETMSADQKKEMIEFNNAARKELLKGVLTAEQMTKYEAFEKEMAAKREQKKAEREASGEKGKGKGKKAKNAEEEIDEEL